MANERIKHHWRVSPIIQNWQNCSTCPQKRRKSNGKFYYEASNISKTYCPSANYCKEHLCPFCKTAWECNDETCRMIEALCDEHDNDYCRKQLGGKWYDEEDWTI